MSAFLRKMMRRNEGDHSGFARWAVRQRGGASALMCGLALIGCGTLPTVSRPDGAPDWQANGPPVYLLPVLTGGTGGWCVTTAAGAGCPSDRLYKGPVVTQAWIATGPPWVARGFILTANYVQRVSLVGGDTYLTTPVPGWEGKLRYVSLTETGVYPTTFPRIGVLDTIRRGKRGEAGESPYLYAPGRSWTAPSRPPQGKCAIASRTRTVAPIDGFVVTRTPQVGGLIGRPFLSCASTRYLLHGQALLAALLVDAKNPRRDPRPLPAMHTLSHHRGVFAALGASGPIVARRVRSGWLVVGEGRTQMDDVRVLDQLIGKVATS